MTIGIDASRAFLKNRTGIEEYSYQVIKSLVCKLGEYKVVLYLQSGQELDFEIPKKWKIKTIRMPRLWTQIGLSFELMINPVDCLFIPAHTVPVLHPKNTVVTIHGLEYEFLRGAYSWWERFYMRLSIKKSCQWAREIISVSENTKRDLMRLYSVPKEKIKVVYEGYEDNSESTTHPSSNQDPDFQETFNNKPYGEIKENPYLLFIGRIEERKNILGIVKAF